MARPDATPQLVAGDLRVAPILLPQLVAGGLRRESRSLGLPSLAEQMRSAKRTARTV